MSTQQIPLAESHDLDLNATDKKKKIAYKYDLQKLRHLDDPPEIFQVDARNLSSEFLNSNPQFQTLLTAILSWNERAKKYNQNPPGYFQKEHAKLAVTNIVIVSLARFLNEVVATTDRKLQIKMLGTVFDWYYREIGVGIQSKGSFYQTNDSSRPNTSTTYHRREASFETGGMRSDHSDYAQPKVRLRDYGRRLPNNPNDNSMMSTTIVSFGKQPFGADISRPQTSPFGAMMGGLSDDKFGRPRTTAGGNRSDYDPEPFNMSGTRIKIGGLLSGVSNREIRSSQDQYRSMRGIFSGVKDQSPEEKKLDLIWYKQRHKFLAEKKEDEELVGFMKEWASNKGRLEEELVRKGEGDRLGSEFNEMRYEVKKKLIMKPEDADLVLQEYPKADNPEHEYARLESGADINKLRVMNEPSEIKGGDEVYVERGQKEPLSDLNYIMGGGQEEKPDRFSTPDREKVKKKEFFKSKGVLDSIQSTNTATTGIAQSGDKGSVMGQGSVTIANSAEAHLKEKKEETKTEIDLKLRKAKERSAMINKKRPSTENQKQRRFIKYKMVNNDRLMGDICDSPVIKILKPGQRAIDIEQEEKKIKILDFTGQAIKPSTSASLLNFESEIGKQKIKEIRSQYGEFLHNQPIANSTDSWGKPSLSIYSRPLSQQNAYKKFSNIFHPKYSKEAIRNEQLNEVEEVRRRMGKWGVCVSAKKLENGLVMPIMVLGSGLKAAEPGMMLIDNPFLQEVKKKKKGDGKKHAEGPS